MSINGWSCFSAPKRKPAVCPPPSSALIYLKVKNDDFLKLSVTMRRSGTLPPSVRDAPPGERSERGRLLPFVNRGRARQLPSAIEKCSALCTPQVAPFTCRGRIHPARSILLERLPKVRRRAGPRPRGFDFDVDRQQPGDASVTPA